MATGNLATAISAPPGGGPTPCMSIGSTNGTSVPERRTSRRTPERARAS